MDQSGGTGLSRTGLETIRKEFDRAIKSGEIAGAVAIIGRHGKPAFYEAAGMKDRENGDFMQQNTIFRIASLTKIVTSVAAMILHEEGKLNLDAPVADFIEPFRDAKVLEKDAAGWKEVPARRPMTVRHLFTHTAGLTYGWFPQDRLDHILQEKEVMRGNDTVADMVAKLTQIPLKHQPGEIWEYSLATDVLGRVVEIISGQTLAEFFERRIFAPLGMVDTTFVVPEERRGRLAIMYRLNESKQVERAESHLSALWKRDHYFGGGGGLSSTASDYYTFLQMLLSSGAHAGVRIVKEETVKTMATNHIPGTESSERTPWLGNHGFGLGLNIYDAPANSGVCYGWSGATGTYAWVNFEKDMAGVFMTHLGDHGPAHKFEQLAHEALED